MDYNPRFIAYAEAHGRTPEEQIAADRVEYPCSCMAGFISWMAPIIHAFEKVHELPNAASCMPAEFTLFVQEYAKAQTKVPLN